MCVAESVNPQECTNLTRYNNLKVTNAIDGVRWQAFEKRWTNLPKIFTKLNFYNSNLKIFFKDFGLILKNGNLK